MYKVCNNCVMDTSDRNITFNSEGICSHCLDYKKTIKPKHLNQIKNKKNFERLISSIKLSSSNKEYDCIIGLSGGLDSSYLVFTAKKLGLNPLIFHADTGWNSKLSSSNIEKIISNLNLDLYTYVIDWNEMRDIQLSFFKSGVPHIDSPQDHAIFASLYKHARKFGIKYILTGANYASEGINSPVDWLYYQSDDIQLKNIQNKFGNLKLKNFPITSPFFNKFLMPYIYGIKTLRLLDFIDYKKDSAENELINHLNWTAYEEKHYESRFTKFYESYWLYERFGFDLRKIKFSNLILSNQIEREDALKQLHKKPYNENKIDEDKIFISNKLGITKENLNKYLIMPLKSFRDYKSRYFSYYIGARIYKYLGKELSLKK